MITPASPSITTQSSCRIRRLASRAPTTAGMSMLRATIAVCDVRPPTSVTKPLNTLRLNWSMSAGAMSLATSTSGSSPPKSGGAGAVIRFALPSRLALERGQHPLGNLLQVGLALAQVLVLHLVELAGQHLELRRQRPLGVVVSLAHPARRGADQILVMQQHLVHVEQCGQLMRRIRRQIVLQRGELGRDFVARPRQARHLLVRPVRRDEVVRHVHSARSHQHRTTDRDALGHRQAEDLHRHRAALTRLRRSAR